MHVLLLRLCVHCACVLQQAAAVRGGSGPDDDAAQAAVVSRAVEVRYTIEPVAASAEGRLSEDERVSETRRGSG